MNLLRFFTAGNVDDGKSTLIGRLLWDSKVLLADQISALESASTRQGIELNLALLTDGLKDERTRGVTIDVAHRYFATARRKFIAIDTPGHVEYVRNMVTGASHADVAVLLVDAVNGVVEQTRRHALICSVLGIRKIILCVNKMDLVGFSETRFRKIYSDFTEAVSCLAFESVDAVPISALLGDGVVSTPTRMTWYTGLPLLSLLETIELPHPSNAPFRFVTQLKLRDSVYAGVCLSGESGTKRKFVVHPGSRALDLQGYKLGNEILNKVEAPRSVSLLTAQCCSVTRGDVVSRADEPPPITATDLNATVCWFDENPVTANSELELVQLARTTKIRVNKIEAEIELSSYRNKNSNFLAMNAIGTISMIAESPIVYDAYSANRLTGSFALRELQSGRTVGAGMFK